MRLGFLGAHRKPWRYHYLYSYLLAEKIAFQRRSKISDLKGKVKVTSTEMEPQPAYADLFCMACQTVRRHEFLNPEDPTRVKCSKCGGSRDLNAWEPEESEISLAGYSPSDDDEA